MTPRNANRNCTKKKSAVNAVKFGCVAHGPLSNHGRRLKRNRGLNGLSEKNMNKRWCYLGTKDSTCIDTGRAMWSCRLGTPWQNLGGDDCNINQVMSLPCWIEGIGLVLHALPLESPELLPSGLVSSFGKQNPTLDHGQKAEKVCILMASWAKKICILRSLQKRMLGGNSPFGNSSQA